MHQCRADVRDSAGLPARTATQARHVSGGSGERRGGPQDVGGLSEADRQFPGRRRQIAGARPALAHRYCPVRSLGTARNHVFKRAWPDDRQVVRLVQMTGRRCVASAPSCGQASPCDSRQTFAPSCARGVALIRDDLPVHQVDRAVAGFGQPRGVGDHPHGATVPFVEAAKQFADVCGRPGVEVAGGLVSQQQRRPRGPRAGMATRCCWPPDSWSGRRWLISPGPVRRAGRGPGR